MLDTVLNGIAYLALFSRSEQMSCSRNGQQGSDRLNALLIQKITNNCIVASCKYSIYYFTEFIECTTPGAVVDNVKTRLTAAIH